MVMSLYFIFEGSAFLTLFLLANKIHFVLSSPKCILNLLSTNQSHKLEKFVFNTLEISFISLCWYIMQESSAYKSKSQDIAYGIPFM